jgi:hypothetical protein
VSGYGELVASALAAVRVHSATSFSWFGQRTPPLPRSVAIAMDAAASRAYLLHLLRLRLYGHLYCQGIATPADQDDDGERSRLASAEFVAGLSAANTGRGTRDPGWTVHAADAGRVVVERRGLRVWATPGDVCLPDGAPPEPGTPVAVRLPKELRKLSPGFYLALGDHGLRPSEAEPQVRLYWNLFADAAPRLMRSVTTRLNRAGIPFNLKVPNHPERYTRCDAGVLYLPKRCYPGIAQMVGDLYEELRDALQPGTPAFTKRLAPGLALAEDPGAGESFGTHRCRLLAEGVVRAWEQGRRSGDGRLAAVADTFAAAGVAWDRPYLNPGSADDYPPLAAAVTAGAGAR